MNEEILAKTLQDLVGYEYPWNENQVKVPFYSHENFL